MCKRCEKNHADGLLHEIEDRVFLTVPVAHNKHKATQLNFLSKIKAIEFGGDIIRLTPTGKRLAQRVRRAVLR